MVPWYIWFVYFLFVYFASDNLCRFVAVEIALCCQSIGRAVVVVVNIAIDDVCARHEKDVYNSSWTHTHTHCLKTNTRCQHNYMREKFGPISTPSLVCFSFVVDFRYFSQQFIYLYSTHEKRRTEENYKCEIKTRNWRSNQKLEEEKNEKKKEKEKRIFTMAYHSRTFSFVSSVFWSFCCTPRFISAVASTRKAEFQLWLLQRFSAYQLTIWYDMRLSFNEIWFVWKFQNFVGRFFVGTSSVWCGVVWLFSRYLNFCASALRYKFDSVRCYITALVCFPFGAWLAALDAVT